MAGLGGACYLENSKAKWDCPGASQIRNEMCTGILCVVINRHGVYLSVWAWGKYTIISRKKKLWLGPFLSRTASWPTKWAQSFSQNLLLGFIPVSWVRPFILRHILLLQGWRRLSKSCSYYPWRTGSHQPSRKREAKKGRTIRELIYWRDLPLFRWTSWEALLPEAASPPRACACFSGSRRKRGQATERRRRALRDSTEPH